MIGEELLKHLSANGVESHAVVLSCGSVVDLPHATDDLLKLVEK